MSEETKNSLKSDVIDIESKFKDIKSIDDLDFDNIQEMGRGKTPEDIEERCLKLCKDYLGGNWSQQTLDSIEVRRITGGLMNQIYYCAIRQKDSTEKVPQEVSVRIYGQTPFDAEDKERRNDMIISLVFSEKNLGPKIYGMFEGGQIQKFYKHRQFKGDDQKNSKLVEKVFQALARIHALRLPLKKNSNKMIAIINESYEEASKKFPINEFIDEFNCQTLKKYNLKSELDWVNDVIERLQSPVVFTHNDFRSSNLMITEPDDELVVCDFDLSCYGYRGYDFAALMREWGRKQFELKTVDGIPLDSQFKPMIEIYVEECKRIHGKSYSENEINSVEHILKEVKVFLMFSYMFFTVIPMRGRKDEEKKENDEPPNYKFMMDFAEMNYKHYHTIKDLLNKQNIFD